MEMIDDLFANLPGLKLHKTAFLVAKLVEKELVSRTELTFPQFMTMVLVDHKASCKQAEMAEMGHLTEAAVSRMVEVMVDKGLLSRKENPESRREHKVEMTDKGKKNFVLATKVVKEKMDELLDNLTDQEQDKLNELLDKILKVVYTSKVLKYA